MPFVLFHDHFPQVAEKETRIVRVMPGSQAGLPWGEYAFLEMFCDERGCDCRRVFFYVVYSRSKELEAVLTYGWEPPSFYARWLTGATPHDIADMKGPSLNVGTPQSPLAPEILELFKTVLLTDTDYMERVKRHYGLFRKRIDAPRRTKRKSKI